MCTHAEYWRWQADIWNNGQTKPEKDSSLHSSSSSISNLGGINFYDKRGQSRCVCVLIVELLECRYNFTVAFGLAGWQVKPQPRQSKAICLVVGRKSVSHLVNSEEQYASHPLMSFAITVPILLLCLCHLNRIPNSTVNFSSLLFLLFLCYFFEEVQHRRRYIV